MDFSNMSDDSVRIATRKVKWDVNYQKKHGIDTHRAKDLSPELDARIARICKRVYRALHISGYARIDLRLTDEKRIFVIEANANPNLEYGEDFAESAEVAGVEYDELLKRIINLGLRHKAAWKE